MAQQPSTGPRIPPQNDLYTVLLIVAASVLFIGIAYLIGRSVQLYDWPWGMGSS